MADVTCSGTCTLALTVAPAPLSASEATDYTVYFFLMFGVCVVCWAIRKTSNLFWNNHEA